MSIYAQKADNTIKLLEGLSLLDTQDQERIISVINTLDFAGKKAEKPVFMGTSLSKVKKHHQYILIKNE